MKWTTNTTKKMAAGFTLAEILMAISIFMIVMTIVSQVFVKVIGAYRQARDIQKDLEQSQQVMNYLTKTLRTSDIVSPGVWPNVNNSLTDKILVYDHSQGKCIWFTLEDNALKIQAESRTNETCNPSVFLEDVSNKYKLTSSEIVVGKFSVIRNYPVLNPSHFGRVTVSLQICSRPGCATDGTPKTRIQSSVSLRNYREVGI